MPRLIASLLALAALLVAVPGSLRPGTRRRRSARPRAPRSCRRRGPASSGCTTSSGRSTSRPGRTRSSSRATRSSPTCPATSCASSPTSSTPTGRSRASTSSTSTTACGSPTSRRCSPPARRRRPSRRPRATAGSYDPSDKWVMNHMIHNLTPTPTDVYITYDLDFIPAGTEADQDVKDVSTVWLDVVGGIYPVFDVHKGAGGRDRRYTYPDEAPPAERGAAAWTVQQDGVLVGTAGHLHPGGLWTDLKVTRGGRTVRVFRSKAKYYEPAGAVSWDVSMTATPENWRVGVRKGDVRVDLGHLRHAALLLVRVDGDHARRVQRRRHRPRPVRHRTSTCPARSRTGTCAENRNHGGALRRPARRAAAALRARRAPSRTVPVSGFLYGQGDLGMTGRKGRPPTIRPGQTLRFVNRDAKRNIFHTITSCRAPCNGATGIAYPLAERPGALRLGQPRLRAGRARRRRPSGSRWRTPKTIRPGTYTYFCRVHPFMRGAFRVTPKAERARSGARALTRRAGPSAPRPGGRSPRARAAPARTWRSSPQSVPGATKIRRAARPAASSGPDSEADESHSSGPTPGAKARSVPASTAARCSRSAAAARAGAAGSARRSATAHVIPACAGRGDAERRRQPVQQLARALRPDRVAGAEAGHRVRLGERAQDEQALELAGQRRARSAPRRLEVGERGVEQDPGARAGAPREPPARRGADRRARRVVGRAQRRPRASARPRAAASASTSAAPSRPSGTGTGRRPPRARAAAAAPSPATRSPRRRRAASAPQRRAQQLAGAVAGHDLRRLDAVARRERLARSAGGGVRVGVDGAPQRERRRVDDLGVRRLVPRRRGEVERRDLGQRLRALLVAPLRAARCETSSGESSSNWR